MRCCVGVDLAAARQPVVDVMFRLRSFAGCFKNRVFVVLALRTGPPEWRKQRPAAACQAVGTCGEMMGSRVVMGL